MDEQEGYRIREWGGTLSWEAFAREEPGPGEVLVQVEACGIGLTVANYMNGNLTSDPSLLPRVPGHEMVGRVAALGAGVDPSLLGRRVVAYFYLSCGRCPACLLGDEPLCHSLGGWIGTHRDGGYAPWSVLPARNVIPVPESLDPISATVIPDAVATPLHVCGRRAGLRPGDRAVIIGAGGGVGIHMVQVAMLFGAEVAGVDVTDEKLELIERFGARAIDGRSLPPGPGFSADKPPTAVIDLVGTGETLGWGAHALQAGGRLVVVTTVREGRLSLFARELVFREIAVLGSRYARRSEVTMAAELVNRGQVEPVVGRVSPPSGVPAVHAALLDRSLLGRGAVSWVS